MSPTRGGSVVRFEFLPAAERRAVPWKNGGGVTREVAVRPECSDLEHFDWRVSIAEVRSGGPFSVFPGIDRCMAVLEGRLSLSIERQAAVEVSPDSPPVSFPGEAAVDAEPLGARVMDLNVMTRRGRFESRLTRLSLEQAQALPFGPGATVLLALSPLRVRHAGEEFTLERLDAMLIEGGGESRCVVLPSGGATSSWLIEIAVLR